MKKLLKNYKNKFEDNLNAANNLAKIKASLSFAPEDEYNISPEPKAPKRGFKWAYVAILATVAIIATIITTVLLVGDSNRPVYKGMEIANSTLLSLDSSIIDDEIADDLPDIITDDSINSFARPNEEVIIRIKIDNPKAYEILSFTLNDYKYQSFEFLEGSSGTEILVKYKAPANSGIHEITINALKYVNGNKIKECRYEGEKTIRLGVTYINIPSIEVLAEDLKPTRYSLAYRLLDVDKLIKLDGYTKYYLFSDDGIVAKGVLANNMDKIEIDGLRMDTSYRLIIASTIDLLDGKGMKTIYLYERELKTLAGIKDLNVIVEEERLEANPIKEAGVAIVGSRLYIGDTLYKENNSSTIAYKDIYSNTEYRLEVIYEYELKGIKYKESYFEDIKTLEYKLPELKGNSLVVGSKLYLDYELVGNSSLIKAINVDIYLDDIYYGSLASLNSSIVIDRSYSSISLKIKLKYDLHDNLGEKEIIYDRLAG